MSASPDRKSLALIVRQALPDWNRYCSGLVVISLDGHWRMIDSGEDTLFYKYPNLLGKANFPTGIAKVVTPRWSPDGRSIAFLKSIDGVSQIWLSNLDNGAGAAITSSPTEVLDFSFSLDGRSIVFRTDAPQQEMERLATDGLSGFHFDDRFSPIVSNRPFLRGPLPQAVMTLELDGLTVRAASPAEAEQLERPASEASPQSWQAGTERAPDGARRIVAERSSVRMVCRHILCTKVLGRPWMSGSKAIGYMRREGWAGSTTAIYQWRVGSTAPTKRYATEDLLLDCADLTGRTICARETSRRPRHLAEIDLRHATANVLFDPNPAFARFHMGEIQRRRWLNDRGIECFGDLVFPLDYQAGRTYPLLVVQYTSRGFLRGGTGDEFPVQIFARLGYFVLNIERPNSPFAHQPGLSSIERQRLDMKDFAERKSILSAIETQVGKLVTEGFVDRTAIGITGLSDGSTTVQFAMLNSRLFSAASATGCCWEPSQAWTLGPAIQKSYADVGWPRFTDRESSFWSDISLSKNADRVHVPLLIQASDDEYLGALESYTALREAKASIDLYVYPDEHHIKWQPAHRLNVYRRNLDWFEFWLRHRKPVWTVDAELEDRRWTAMRSRPRSLSE